MQKDTLTEVLKMPIEKVFSEHDIQELIDANAEPKYGPRNTALIIAASYWGLTRIEMCELPLKAIMSKSGEWYRRWVLPGEVSYTGEPRELCTGEHIVEALDNYVEWLKQHEVGGTNIQAYRGLDPDMAFLVNDKLGPYKLTKRSKKLPSGKVSYQPRSLDDKLKSLIANTSIKGATVTTFRDSWVKMMYDNGCGYNELKAVSGIKSKVTLELKIRPQERELQKVFDSVFSRVHTNVEQK